MAYTWQDVLKQIDVGSEERYEKEEKERIGEIQASEATAMSLWSLGLSVLGGYIFGPSGYYAGKNVGKWIGDVTHNWEDKEIDPGKFNKEDIEEYNKTLKKVAKDQNYGHVVNAVTDIGAMYVMSGGLTAEPGEWDPTTFGSGDAEWSVRGRGTPATSTPGSTEYVSGVQFDINPPGYVGPNVHPPTSGYFQDIPSQLIPASEDYVPSLFGGGGFLKETGNLIGKTFDVYTQDRSLSDLGNMAASWVQSRKAKEDKV
jgi:hypothetical protein